MLFLFQNIYKWRDNKIPFLLTLCVTSNTFALSQSLVYHTSCKAALDEQASPSFSLALKIESLLIDSVRYD